MVVMVMVWPLRPMLERGALFDQRSFLVEICVMEMRGQPSLHRYLQIFWDFALPFSACLG